MEKSDRLRLKSCRLNFRDDLVADDEAEYAQALRSSRLISSLARSSGLRKNKDIKDFFYRNIIRPPNTGAEAADQADINIQLDHILEREEFVAAVYNTNENSVLMHLGAKRKLHDLDKMIAATQSEVLKIKKSRLTEFYDIVAKFTLQITHILYYADLRGTLTGIELNKCLGHALQISEVIKDMFESVCDEEFEVSKEISEFFNAVSIKN